MQIQILQEGEQFGPYSKPQIESYLWDGTIKRDDLAWYEGLKDWIPVWQVMGMPNLSQVEEIVPEPEPEISEPEIPEEIVEIVVEPEPESASEISEPEPDPQTAEPEPADLPTAEDPSTSGRPRLVIPMAPVQKRRLKLGATPDDS
ncbi:MAG: hypothetical protein ACI8T1_002192 [Verrucomicrobiales bacterium]|jgi:hypothetical protein